MGEAQRDEIAKLEALYAANPEGRVFTHLAEAYRKAGNLDRAREILEEGLGRHPDSATAYVVLGRVGFDGGRHDDARAAFARALQLDEGNLVAHRYLGELALAEGDAGSARRHFGELLARNPLDESLLARMRDLEALPREPEAVPGDAPSLAGQARETAPAEAPDAAVAESPDAAASESREASAAEAPGEGVAEGWAGAVAEAPEESTADAPGDAAAPLAEEWAGGVAGPAASGGAEDAAFPDWTGAEPVEEEEPWARGVEPVSWSGEEQPVDAGEFPGPAGEAEEGQAGVAWSLPEEGSDEDFSTEGEPLPTLDLAGMEAPVEGGAGTSAEPWSWHEPPTGEAETAAELERFGSLGDLPGSDWQNDTLDPESLPHLEGLEPLPEFDGEPFGAEPETPVAAPDDGTWRPYPVGDAAVYEALADAGAVEADALAGGGAAEADASPDAGAAGPEAEVAGAGLADAAAGSSGTGAQAGDVLTETIAELYRKQGFPDRAADVYRSLLLRRPEDARLRERLAEVEQEVTTQAPAAGEVWAGAADAAFTGGGGAAVGEATPYAWDQVEEEPSRGGDAPPIGAYFESLLHWRSAAGSTPEERGPSSSGAGAAGEDAGWEAPGPAGGWEAPPAGDGSAGEWDAAAEWEAPSGAEEPAAELQFEAEAEPLPEAELLLEPEAEVLPEAELLLEPEAEVLPASERTGSEPASEAEIFTGWTPDMLLDAPPPVESRNAPELMPWEVPEPPSLAAPEAERPLAEPSPAGSAEADAAAAPDAADAPAGGEGEEEDEDLEMFRSWLQSLKK